MDNNVTDWIDVVCIIYGLCSSIWRRYRKYHISFNNVKSGVDTHMLSLVALKKEEEVILEFVLNRDLTLIL